MMRPLVLAMLLAGVPVGASETPYRATDKRGLTYAQIDQVICLAVASSNASAVPDGVVAALRLVGPSPYLVQQASFRVRGEPFPRFASVHVSGHGNLLFIKVQATGRRSTFWSADRQGNLIAAAIAEPGGRTSAVNPMEAQADFDAEMMLWAERLTNTKSCAAGRN